MSCYAVDGSWNVTVVTGSAYTGLYASDGSLNVITSPGSSYVGSHHPCGAMWVTPVTTSVLRPLYSPDGSLYVTNTGMPSKNQGQPVTVVSGSLFGTGTTTLDPAKKGSSIVLSNGNLTSTGSGAFNNFSTVLSISGHTTGKFYCEAHIDLQLPGLGIGNGSMTLSNYLGQDLNSIQCNSSGQVFINGSLVTTIGTFTAGDTVSMAVDLGNQKAWWRVNSGGWNNDILANQNPASNVGGVSISTLNAGTYFAGTTCNVQGGGPDSLTINFGATSYTQSVPASFGNW